MLTGSPGEALPRLLAAWPGHPQEFYALCQSVADWETFLGAAERHGVLGVLAPALAGPAAGLAPQVLALVEERRVVERLWGSRLSETLAEALAALAAAGVPVLALKGPVLSERLYADPLARRSADLDLLVRVTDFPRAKELLEGLGYRAEPGPTARYRRRHHHHLCMVRTGSPAVELHFRAFSGFGTTIAAEEVFARATPYRTRLGPTCLVLAPEDEVLYLGVHAAGHDLERLSWLYDLKTFRERYPALDWPTVFARARSAKVAVPLAFSLDALGRRLGVAVPDLGPLAERSGLRWRLAGRLVTRLGTWPPEAARAKVGSLVLQALLCDRASAGLWYLRHHFGRIARRWLRRRLPRFVPYEWSA